MVTIVTAVNKAYMEKFKANFPLYHNTKFLVGGKDLDLRWLFFFHNDCYSEGVKFLAGFDIYEEYVDWCFEQAKSDREEMLSAFVFGVARFVKTRYWIKLDCDHKPKSNIIDLPEDFFRYALTAHKWGYTKVKYEDDWKKRGHWLNRLDDWADKLEDFEGTKPLFPKGITTARYSHPRVCTFFAIEKTVWTKHLADMCNRSGRVLPVPSQDGCTWYGITRLGNGRTVNRTNMKRYFSS